MGKNLLIETMKKYLAFSIGCLECHLDSEVIGVYSTEKKAWRAIEGFEALNGDGGSSYSHEVFQIKV